MGVEMSFPDEVAAELLAEMDDDFDNVREGFDEDGNDFGLPEVEDERYEEDEDGPDDLDDDCLDDDDGDESELD